jgi:hypothetical protein
METAAISVNDTPKPRSKLFRNKTSVKRYILYKFTDVSGSISSIFRVEDMTSRQREKSSSKFRLLFA